MSTRELGAAAHGQVDLLAEAATGSGHLALVGKGIMYDSGGICLKPSDAFHASMKMDMSGAAAVLVDDVGAAVAAAARRR